jgi:intracellular multiplication protein IcmO
VALPTMGKDVAASNFGKMVLGDFRTAVSWLQANKADRPKIPYMCFFDEAGSYVNESWARIFEQARSAGIFLCPAVQTESNFKAISEDFAEMVTGNTTTKLVFRVGSQSTAESVADLIGTHLAVRRSMTSTDSASKSQDALRAAPGATTGDSSGESYAEREEEVHRVDPNKLKALEKGEAVMLYEGKHVFNLRIPFVGLTPEMKKKIGPIRINKPRFYKREGFNFIDPDKLDRFLSTTHGNRGDGHGNTAP